MSLPTLQDVLTTLVSLLKTTTPLLKRITSLLLKTTTSVLLFTIVIILAIAVYRLYLHPLAGVPGPCLAALSNIWHACHARNGRMYQLGTTLHKRYGPVVRVGPNELWFDSKEAFKTIYSAGSGFEKSDFYLSTLLTKPTLSLKFSPFKFPFPSLQLRQHHPDTLDLLSERHLPRYRLQRRLIGPLYQLSSLKKFEPQIDAVLDRAIAQLRTLQGQEVDLKEWMHIIAVECLGAVVLSWSPGYIRDKSDGGTSVQGYRGWKRKSVFGLFPSITVLSFLEGGPFGIGAKIGKGVARWWSNTWGVTFATPKGFKPFFTAVYQKVSRRVSMALLLWMSEDVKVVKPSKKNKHPKPAGKKQDKGTGKKDLLEDLIRLHQSKPEQFTETYLRRMAMTNFGAGHETLCSALTACMAMLGTHAAVQARVAEEVGSHLRGGGTVPFDTTAKQLPYTLAAIKEAQRLHPVIAMSLSRTVPRDLDGAGVMLHGHWVPEGTTVGCNPVALHRNTEIFGDDADVYNPSRWLSRHHSGSSSSSPPSKAGSNAGVGSDAGSEIDSELAPEPEPDSDSSSKPPQPNLNPEEEAERKRLREMLHLNLTYGGGARTCPGRHLAELIVWKVIPRLVAEFRVQVTHMPDDENMERYFMSMLTGVKVRFLEREDIARGGGTGGGLLSGDIGKSSVDVDVDGLD
ncbi:cytochrome P450 [Neurospora hispaniola]|uniref:Cytochrome P450 n=1 Tax=Neurospora hispaniola TaxID=588809 RepID=A0AAJ0MNA8_9PEZI|nr:cytochrome P450 [Neurospora hispaniola]